jgi:competence protein CoiA
MKYALINAIKTEATKGAKGICPNCGLVLIAKCGDVRTNHWSHAGNRNCDLWWEKETEWHRAWKGKFPSDWQEVILYDETGEKHIADLRTVHELVIEFQHSFIEPQERIKRENFYKKMVWVVDGTRLMRDYPRFLKGKESFRPTNQNGLFTLDYTNECFPSSWTGSSRHVVFDFKGLETIDDPNDDRHYLYYLFPKTNIRERFVAKLTRESFIANIMSGKWFSEEPQPEKQDREIPIAVNHPFRTQSQYVLERGKWVKKKRL